jgi:hypothetical protein
MSVAIIPRPTRLPSAALAPSRKRRYTARTTATQAIERRALSYIAALSITPTIRQFYYVLSNEGLIVKSEKRYKALVRQLTSMRKGGVLPYAAFIDGTRDRKLGYAFDGPSDGLRFFVQHVYRRMCWADQPVVAEVWAEADTMSQMLWQVADPLVVPVVICRGNSSLSQLYACALVIRQRWEREAAQRIRQRWGGGQRTAILYVGDCDPAGMDMSDHLHARLVDVGAPAEAFTVKRLAITEEQIRRYELQSHPPKRLDARTPAFIERYGVACVEVEALPAEVLSELVTAAIEDCIWDPDAWDEQEAQEERDLEALRWQVEAMGDTVDQAAAAGKTGAPDRAPAEIVHVALLPVINALIRRGVADLDDVERGVDLTQYAVQQALSKRTIDQPAPGNDADDDEGAEP